MIWKIWKKSKLKCLPYFSYLFTIQLAFLPYCPYLITIRLAFLPYYPYHFTFQLTFPPYFPYQKASWNVKWYGKYGRKISWIVNDFENTEEKCEMIGKIWKKSKLNSDQCCPYLFTIQPTLLPYFSYVFTIFFCIFQIIYLFNLGFFHIFHIISQFSSVFSKSYHYSTWVSSVEMWNDMENIEER
jgi:hypothetical protein